MLYTTFDIPEASIVINEAPASLKRVSELDDVKYTNITAKTPINIFKNFVAIDVETTGLSVTKNEIVEVSAIRFRDGLPVEKFHTYTYPKRGIQPEAFAVNKISNEMVEHSPAFTYIAKSLEDFIGKDNIIAHNLEFDLKFIYHYGVDVLKYKRRYYDTLQIAQRKLKKPKRKWNKEFQEYDIDYDADYDVDDHKLSTLCRYYDIDVLSTHTADDDCLAAGMLFIKLGEDYRPSTISLDDILNMTQPNDTLKREEVHSNPDSVITPVKNESSPDVSSNHNKTKDDPAMLIKNKWAYVIAFFLFLFLTVLIIKFTSSFLWIIPGILAGCYAILSLKAFYYWCK